MKTAEEFLKDKLKEYGYDEQLYEKHIKYAKNDIVRIMGEYRNQYHPTTLPSDEEIKNWKHSVSDVYGAEMSNFQTPEGFKAWEIGMKQMRSLCEAKIAEMEREMKDFRELARLVSALNEEHEHFKSIAGYIKLARKLLTTTTP